MKVKQFIAEPQGELSGVPSVKSYEGALGQAVAGMNRVGQGLVEIAKVGEAIWKKRKDDRRNIDIQKMQIETERDWLAFKTGYDRSNPDPVNYTKDVEKGWDDIVKQQLGMTKDGETARLYKDKMNARKIMILSQAYGESEKRFHDAYYADSLSNVDELAKLASDTENPEDAEIFKNDMLNEIHKGYPFTEEFARGLEVSKIKEIETGRAKNAEGRVKLDILNDPGQAAINLMLPPESGQYPEIKDPLLREQLKKSAEQIFSQKQREQRDEDNRIAKSNHDSEEVSIGSLYATGRLKIEDVQKSQFLTGDERYAWVERLRARQEKVARGEPIKTNYATYAGLLNAISTGQPKGEVTKMIGAAAERDLSEQDAENLLNKLTTYEGHFEDRWTKKSYDYLKSQICKASDVNMVGDIIGAQAAEDYYKAINLLDSAIAEAKRKGKPLSGEEIFNQAKKILPLVKRTGREMLGQIKKERETEKSKPKSNVPKRNKGESVSDYLKRIGQE